MTYLPKACHATVEATVQVTRLDAGQACCRLAISSEGLISILIRQQRTNSCPAQVLRGNQHTCNQPGEGAALGGHRRIQHML